MDRLTGRPGSSRPPGRHFNRAAATYRPAVAWVTRCANLAPASHSHHRTRVPGTASKPPIFLELVPIKYFSRALSTPDRPFRPPFGAVYAAMQAPNGRASFTVRKRQGERSKWPRLDVFSVGDRNCGGPDWRRAACDGCVQDFGQVRHGNFRTGALEGTAHLH